MTRHGATCLREADVLDLVARGQWPQLADGELEAHAGACPLCSELVAAAGAIVELRNEADPPALPDASAVWYRAEVRARAEAERKASSPVFLAQAIAVVAALGLGLLFWTDIAGSVGAWWTSPERVWNTGLPTLGDLWSAISLPVLLLVGGALVLWLVVLPLAFGIARLADRPERPSEPLLPSSKNRAPSRT